MSPREVKATLVWEIAAWLGVGEPTDDDEGGIPSGGDLIEQRLAHARGEGPEPEARPLSGAAMQLAGLALISPPTDEVAADAHTAGRP